MTNNTLKIHRLTYCEQKNNTETYTCSRSDFATICFHLIGEYPYVWLIDFFVETKDSLTANYIFLDMEEARSFKISFDFHMQDELPSITHLWRNAFVFEQDAFELYGVTFSRQYSRKYFTDDSGFPMLNPNSKIVPRVDTMNYDYCTSLDNHFHRNSVLIKAKVENNLIDNCSIDRGGFHIGVEHILESMSIKDTYAYLEGYFFSQGIVYSDLLSRGLEKQLSVKIPNRAQSIRMVLIEFNRVLEHYRYLEQLCYEFKLSSVYSQVQLAIKKIQAILISYCGNESLSGVIRFGGVTKDTSQVWLSRVLSEITWMEGSLLNIYQNIFVKETFRDMLDIQLLSKKLAMAWGVTGPLARCAGLNVDLRKISPSYFYSDINFEVPIGVKGSVYDSLLVNVEEIFQSYKIIIQVLDNLPTGAILSSDMDSFRSITDFEEQGAEQNYISLVGSDLQVKIAHFSEMIEGPRGIYNLYLSHDQGKNNRLKIASPSTINVQLFENVCKGKELEKIKPFWASFNINLKEAEK